jgi:hypothetical protein
MWRTTLQTVDVEEEEEEAGQLQVTIASRIAFL